MGPTKVGWIFVLATLSTTQAFNTVTPWGKEVVYNWRALVKAGTHFPAPFASLFNLYGKIHVQSSENATLVKITDLSHKLYNGRLDHVRENEAHTIPAPAEVQDLQNVFKIVHGAHGEVVSIATEDHEKEFSRNIKKAIATILQINSTVTENPHNWAFSTKEDSIFGYSDVDYVVFPHGTDEIEVHKLHEMKNSSHLYHNFVNNADGEHCDAAYEEILMHDSKKKYIISKQNGHHVVKSIVSNGAIYYYPFNAQSDAQYIFVNQTFQLIEVVPIQQQFHVKSEHLDLDLVYQTAVDTDSEAIPDLTNGRQVVDYAKLISKVHQLIKEVPQYLQQNHIDTKPLDPNQIQLINRIQRILKYFTMEKLEELSKTFSGEDLDIFHRMLPLVGSKASTLYVKHLVVHKLVTDELAVDLLQHLPEHVIIPSLDQLTELEVLIHLNESFAWKVRRVAILSFATLIQKSYIRNLKANPTNSEDVQRPYEKYIVEYINNIKNSKDYKIQLTYTFAFLNMRLPNVIQHLLPIMRGELGRNLRFVAIWAAGHSLRYNSNPDTVMETFWPIFTNREEPTEVRVVSYFFIMESQPSHTRLKNIFWYMLTEPNEELYQIHYSYVQTMVRSKDPCKQTTGIKLAQLLKFMHPPSHGVSWTHRNDYRDASYGFGAGLQDFLIKTNESLLYGIITNEQIFHEYRENDLFFVRLHGVHGVDIKLPKIHFEIALFKHGNVIDTYYFDESNNEELQPLLNFLTKDTHSVDKTLLDISYDKYFKTMIPTDLGIPAVWEYLQPEVQQHKFNIAKETANRIISIQIHDRHVDWIHYRHGLNFYNPFADVWQGVTRIHSYDSVLPVNLAISFDIQKQSLQTSWTKQDNPQMNVAGVRSHVQQMVFVQDDFQRHALIQSSPTSKEWQIVSNGDQYRHDYTIIDHDDLNTGHKWYMGLFDCGQHVSNGSFYHIVHQLIQPYTKSFDSPIDHLWLSWANWRQELILSPKPGVYGLIFKMEPSHEHKVTNVGLSLRVHQDGGSDNKYPYTPGGKWSTRLIYDVKNKEQSLKTWDVNAILDMNPGHTVNNLKMHLTRTVPGLQDYNICVDGVKRWNQTGVTGHLNVATSRNPDGKCAKEDEVIDVTMTGERSFEQDHEHILYGSCHYDIPYSVAHYHTLQCLASHSSVRHYVYNVKTTNVPSEFKKVVAQWWDRVKSYYYSYYTYKDEHSEKIGEHDLVVDVVYPMQDHSVDVHITTPHHVYELTGVPTDYWRSWGLTPDSTVYSKWFQDLHKYGRVNHCYIYHDHRHYNHRRVDQVVPNEWTLYIGEGEGDTQWGVYVKHIGEDQIAVKAVNYGHILEIVPHGDNHQITLDGHVVDDQEQHHEEWVYYHVFVNDVNHPVAVMLPESGVHLEYDLHHVVVIVPKGKEDEQLHGQCVESHH